MVSLLPAVATVGGLVVLPQPSLRDGSGLALVIAGVVLHRDPAARAADALFIALRVG
jgi:inner membrane transporter RhtA